MILQDNKEKDIYQLIYKLSFILFICEASKRKAEENDAYKTMIDDYDVVISVIQNISSNLINAISDLSNDKVNLTNIIKEIDEAIHSINGLRQSNNDTFNDEFLSLTNTLESKKEVFEKILDNFMFTSRY